MESVVIYGGGNIAHSVAAAIARVQPVTIITRRPECWGHGLVCEQEDFIWRTRYNISATASLEPLNDADVIFILLPQLAHEEVVENCCKKLKAGSTVVFAPGPARCIEYAKKFAKMNVHVVAFQRVPFIARTIDYGHSVRCSLPRRLHKLVVSDKTMESGWRSRCQKWFQGEVQYLYSFLSFVFSNSNPLLHPARLFVLLKNGNNGTYDRCPYFYAEWTDESSKLYIAADVEMQGVYEACAYESFVHDYESVMRHYEVATSAELTHKIRSIESFKTILAPWKRGRDDRWAPDFASRYFAEDIPYGTKVILSYAQRVGLSVPIIEMFAKLPALP